MRLFFIQFVIVVVSISFVFLAPPIYSYDFCLSLFILYLVENFAYFIYSGCGIVSFQGFFALTFLLTNFVYPVFYYPSMPYVGLFKYDFDENIISYGTALALLAYNLYLVGLLSALSKPKFSISSDGLSKSSQVKKDVAIYLLVIVLICFCSFISLGGLEEIRDAYGNDEFGAKSFSNKVLTSLIHFFSLILLLYSFKLHECKTLFYWIIGVLLCISITYLLCGNRGFPLSVFVLMLVAINDYIRKFKLVEILFLILLGIFLLSLISYYRFYVDDAMDSMFEEKKSVLDFALDLIICNRNLYSLISYADNEGYLFFLTKINILSFIPFAQSTVCKLFDIDVIYTTSAAFNSYLTFGDIKGNLGLGTNMVSDIYVSFGTMGVFVCFYMLGYIVQLAKNRSKTSLRYFFVYYLLVSDAVFMCRGSMFGIVKFVIWILCFNYLISKFKISLRG